MQIEISTKDYKGSYEATDGKAAIKLFFGDVLAGRVPPEKLGLVGQWKETGGEDEYPFRIGSALASAGWMTPQELQSRTKAADADLDFSIEQIEAMIAADAWMVDDWPEVIV